MRLAPTFFAAAAALTMAAPAMAHTQTFTAVLTGAAESPTNNSPGTGTATVIIDDHNFTMRVMATFEGLVGNVTASHIHCCTAVAGVSTAGVATVTPSFTAFPSGVKAGNYDRTFDMTLETGSWNSAFVTANGGTRGAAFSALLAGIEDGKAYLNIHTASFPQGEIRGFLQLAPVPEPQTYALMLAGLGVLGWSARRKLRG